MANNSVLQRHINLLHHKYLLSRIHTPLDKAVSQIKARRKDKGLMKEIADFLDHDIPKHFNREDPIFYLSRYVATPDYETLKYIDQVRDYKLPIVIGEDATDIFTSHSTLKRNLAKLPIITGESKDGSGIVQYETVANFNTEQGKQLKDVRVFSGKTLPEFHRSLAGKFLPNDIKIVNESEWVDRHSRGKLVRLYEDMLALLICHGVMLEYYEPDETDFLSEVVLPAMKLTKKRFGLTPLLVPLEEEYSKKIRDLNSYPASIQSHIETALAT